MMNTFLHPISKYSFILAFILWTGDKDTVHVQDYPPIRIIKIMPMGNSITQGNTGHFRTPYRRYLWRQLMENHYTQIDFIGSVNHVYNSSDSGFFNDYDSDHEGHWGWLASELLNGHSSPSPTAGSGKLSVWLQDNIPDVVLLHAGTNEMIRYKASDGDLESYALPALIKTLREIINEFRKSNPDIVIFIAQLIPTRNMDVNERINKLNPLIAALSEEMDMPYSRVIPVNQHEGFDPETDLYDNWHPGPSGAKKMADKWYDQLKLYLDGHLPPYEGTRFGIRLVSDIPIETGKEFSISIVNAKSISTQEKLNGYHPVLVSSDQPMKNALIFNDQLEFSEGVTLLSLEIHEAGIYNLTIEIPETEMSELISVEILQGDTWTHNPLPLTQSSLRVFRQGNELQIEGMPGDVLYSELFCISGHRLQSQKHTHPEVNYHNISHIKPGVYILRINGKFQPKSIKLVLH
jgi:lysophospholipase L1-like esterase